ncbi:MAG: T9SS C-terminal target domain-containing protein, partial [Flavobacteriales bacterium]|nr:T9SS C-terminal target domain-containing protein [Crocinitomicaceae bacterium]NDC92127.1 T9SS C-terminal target domain-containing protein [Flavobacteriales bacterium]
FVLNNPASFSLPFSIFDITGKLIYTSKIESSEMSIDIQNLDAGLYTILVAFEDRIQALRFIKN